MKQLLTSPLHGSIEFNHMPVFVRADLNVPIEHGVILDDYRLKKIIPTLHAIQRKHGNIILGTHLGRPQGHDLALSTRHLAPWFKQHGFNIRWCGDLETAHQASLSSTYNEIILLENLRFYPGEKNNDLAFAKKLHALAAWYVHDAFGLLHQSDCSITTLPELFEKTHRMIGLLIEEELRALSPLIHSPKKPYVVIIGGGKVTDKIPLLEAMVHCATTIVLAPALVFSFLKAQGIAVGNSLVDNKMLPTCLEILKKAHKNNVTVEFPLDYVVAADTFNGVLFESSAVLFPNNGVGISIGQKTVERMKEIFKNAKTIFYNGTMGSLGRPETLEGLRNLFECMASSHAYTVIGGGDSAGVALQYGFEHRINHISTGGGATLALLSGQELPGLKIFLD